MRYYRNVDYFIYFEEFPHMGVAGVIAANSDGTSNIYINTLYSVQRQRSALRHELRHLALQHQYCDWMPLWEKEAEADAEDPAFLFAEDFSYVEYLPCAAETVEEEKDCARVPDVFREAPAGTIPFFSSLESMRRYLLAMREQLQGTGA